jgi:hypothetical protein
MTAKPPRPATRKRKEEAYYPNGGRSVQFELSECGWMSLHSAIAVRIQWFDERIAATLRYRDPDETSKQLPWLYECRAELLRTLHLLEDQVDAAFFQRSRKPANEN